MEGVADLLHICRESRQTGLAHDLAILGIPLGFQYSDGSSKEWTPTDSSVVENK
jgi:hypothetical protein